jgi:hypothetical protein
MRIKMTVAAAALCLPAMASAQSMNADAFYQRATALTAKGMMAIFSSDVKVMMNEGKAAGAAARAQRMATIKAGKKPRYCPPEGPQSMGSTEFLQRLGAIPQADRAKIDMTEAMTRILAVKFPCPR